MRMLLICATYVEAGAEITQITCANAVGKLLEDAQHHSDYLKNLEAEIEKENLFSFNANNKVKVTPSICTSIIF